LRPSRYKRGIAARLALLAVLLLIVLGAQLHAQCHLPSQNQTADRSSKAGTEPLLPESGLLTDDTYTNLFFGFSFRLPISIHGHRLMLPLRLPGEHALLALGFQDNQNYGTLVVTAGGHREEDDHRMTPEQAQDYEDAITRSKPGPGPMSRLDYTPAPIKLKRVDKHTGDVRGAQFTTRLKNYTVRFTIQTNDKAFLDKARKAVEDVQVFCSDDAGTFFSPDGKPFVPRGTVTNGPTIPTAVVEEAIRTRPAEQTIPPGTTSGSAFRIPQLEFSYTLPAGWVATQTPPESSDDDVGDTLSERLFYLWKSCARTLLSAANGQTGAKLELRALDQTCFGLPAPASPSDSLASESLGQYLQMLGRFGQIKSNRLIQSGGRLFSVYEATVSTGQAANNLAARDAEIILITRYGKLLFAWCWRAPTAPELKQLPNSEVRFGSGAPIAIGPSIVTW
jgi:hypothetical protein